MRLHDVTAAVIVSAWILLLVLFRQHGQRTRAPATAVRHLSRLGLILQGIAYAMVFTSSGTRAAKPLGAARPIDVLVLVTAVLLAAASVALAVRSARTLGRHWSLTARTIDGHQLVASGPYLIVRHPIYLAMLGMLWATALVFSGPLLFVAGTAVYLAGAVVRIHAEEALLRQIFGEEYEAYRRAVPALLPLPRLRKAERGRRE